jgi:hypothetical protein
MSRKKKILVVGAAAVLVTAMTAVVGVHPGLAVTAACGSPPCTSPVNLLAGTGEALTISISGSISVTAANIAAHLGSVSVGLATASTTNPGQDWQALQLADAVGVLAGNGGLSPRLNVQYSGNPVVEFEATPDGIPTDECLSAAFTGSYAANDYSASGNNGGIGGSVSGPAFTPGNPNSFDGDALTLSTCGAVYPMTSPGESYATATNTQNYMTTSIMPTAWIPDSNNASNGYLDLINGSSLNYLDPEVLSDTASTQGLGSSGSNVSGNLSLLPLNELGSVVSSGQMWDYSPEGTNAAAIKKDGVIHN